MSENKPKPADLPTKSTDAAAQAREQAKVYDSIFAPTPLTLDDGTTIEVPPHPSLQLLDDEAQAAYERLQFELESYDRHPDLPIPEQRVYDDKGNVTMTIEPTTRRGDLMVPHRKTVGEETTLLDPPYTVRVAQIALGEEDYAQLRAGKVNGRRAGARDVWRIWNEQGVKLAERQAADSKSAAGAVDLAPVSAPDSE